MSVAYPFVSAFNDLSSLFVIASIATLSVLLMNNICKISKSCKSCILFVLQSDFRISSDIYTSTSRCLRPASDARASHSSKRWIPGKYPFIIHPGQCNTLTAQKRCQMEGGWFKTLSIALAYWFVFLIFLARYTGSQNTHWESISAALLYSKLPANLHSRIGDFVKLQSGQSFE